MKEPMSKIASVVYSDAGITIEIPDELSGYTTQILQSINNQVDPSSIASIGKIDDGSGGTDPSISIMDVAPIVGYTQSLSLPDNYNKYVDTKNYKQVIMD